MNNNLIETQNKISSLVERFSKQEAQLIGPKSHYTESEARSEFIDPFFSAFGWDMENSVGTPNSKKDVIREESQKVENSNKRPDYTFRIAAVRKFFVEAKKPSVDINHHKNSAFQARSYGWSAGLSISILTNFRTLKIYDSRIEPNAKDDVDVALIASFEYGDFINSLALLDQIISREEVASGYLEKTYALSTIANMPVNKTFLDRFSGWRLKLAVDLHSRYPSLSAPELDDLAQLIINRFLFIRMCEDRGIETEGTLKKIIGKKSITELRELFLALDTRYNTGLFNSEIDSLQASHHVCTSLLQELVEELYFPKNPFSFSVLDADFLGQVYEVFLVQKLEIDTSSDVCLIDKPSYIGREIVTTPQPVVDELVRKAVSGKFSELSSESPTLEALLKLKVLDLAVGSGRFLIRALDELVDLAIVAAVRAGDTLNVYQVTKFEHKLSFDFKKQLLVNCLFGVDVDFSATEVAKFSLAIKLMEDESQSSLPDGTKILPDLETNIVWGNSVVLPENFNADEPEKSELRPFAWDTENFSGCFDIVIGNPPYVNTEDMKASSKAELDYFKKSFDTAYRQFDKYFLFVETAVKKIGPNGWCGLVVPNKWINIESGKKLRKLLASNDLVSEIVDFGNETIFEGKQTYVCLLFLSKSAKKSFKYEVVSNYTDWVNKVRSDVVEIPTDQISNSPENSWILPSTTDEMKLLSSLAQNSVPLASVADVLNGIQTSAEKIFPISSWVDRGGLVEFIRDGQTWRIERAILRPYLMNSAAVTAYSTVSADALVIYPYAINSDGEARLYSPSEMSSKFPLALTYLTKYKAALEKRNVSPPPKLGEFYAYGRHQALVSTFIRPKIIYSVNQLGNKYSLDTVGVGFASGGTAGEVAISNFSEGYTPELVLAVLLFRPVELYLRKRGSAFRGGYYSRGSAVMKDCPMPIIDKNDATSVSSVALITENMRLVSKKTSLLSKITGRTRKAEVELIETLKLQISSELCKLFSIDSDVTTISLPGEKH